MGKKKKKQKRTKSPTYEYFKKKKQKRTKSPTYEYFKKSNIAFSVRRYSDVTPDKFYPAPGGLQLIEVLPQENRTTPAKVRELLENIADLLPQERPAVTLVIFGGYDEETRPVHRIPEITEWCRRFVEEGSLKAFSTLTIEVDLIESRFSFCYGLGLGLMKIMVLAGYGWVEVPPMTEDVDCSYEASIARLNGEAPPVLPLQYRLNQAGQEMVAAVMFYRDTRGEVC